ncbi:ankyrin repeat domain-containing protein 53 [Lacerta agilis]|uniref:ankyrin repeat domain-containing protein 53 n=1 Tax=Lacerta agilis TaxID=80427 RepID=UPI001419EF85|nr:ankyrin repeat domain-containing protein 53 [Lacerta agilis]
MSRPKRGSQTPGRLGATPSFVPRKVSKQASRILSKDSQYAASSGQVHWLKICIQKAESPTQADINGFSALHTAALYGRLDCIQMLVEKFKVDVNLASLTGWRPIHLVLSKESRDAALECLLYLIKKQADVNVQNQSGVSPLHKAASEGRENCIHALIRAGADVHIKDYEGQKPIDLCRMWGHRSCAKCLASAMWKADKAHFVQEVAKLNKIKEECEVQKIEFLKREQMEINLSNKLAFDQWLAKKHLPPPPARIVRCLDTKRKSVLPRRGTRKKTSPILSFEETVPPRVDDTYLVQKDRRCRPWNVSTNLASLPATCISRPEMVRLGIHPDPPAEHDFTSFLFLYKNGYGKPEIQVDGIGKVLDMPDLPFEVLQKSLYPDTRATRLDVPGDLRALHIFGLRHRRRPGPEHRWTDQMALSLRQTVDPALLGTLKVHLATYSDPQVLFPRLESGSASGKDISSSSSSQSKGSSHPDSLVG